MVLYHHMMSPTDRSSFQHLANYLSMRSRLSSNEILCPMFYDIHVAHNISVIYICTKHFRHLQFDPIFHNLPCNLLGKDYAAMQHLLNYLSCNFYILTNK